MIPFTKTEKGRGMAENRLPDSGPMGGSRIAGSCSRDRAMAIPLTQATASAHDFSPPLYPSPSTRRGGRPSPPTSMEPIAPFSASPSVVFCTTPSRRRSSASESGSTSFSRFPWRIRWLVCLFEYRFWFFSVLPYVPMEEIEAYETKNKLPYPFAIPPLPYSHSPSLFPSPPFARGFGLFMQAHNSRIDPEKSPIPTSIIKAAGFNFDLTRRAPRSSEGPTLPPNPSTADMVAAFRDYYPDCKVQKRGELLGFFVPAVEGRFDNFFAPMPKALLERLAREEGYPEAQEQIAKLQLVEERWDTAD
ncbi:hypothetical protein BCR35DRAFT_167928 [Leucosporidium creatinivorum]|uniref:Uncharacterized protein n=1 Tax=Leucosporidium creatinivorum TaxID=106004 RepID=A0A1Y2ECY0_9BASI|nr:hypothetical protein BCR35DRAFT_167928 [Leucosporidium creatinivorum]